jgi:Transglycosylase SLT domain
MGSNFRRRAARANAVPGISTPASLGSPASRRFVAAGVIALAAVGAQVAAPLQPAALAVAVPHPMPAAGWSAGSPATGSPAAGGASSFRRIILPDLLIVAPKGLTGRQQARLRQIAGVRNMITFDGAEIRANGQPASVIGVNPAQFRSWVPLGTASDQAFWTALSRGFVASPSAKARLRLRTGGSYQLSGGTIQAAKFGAAAPLGVAGVDLLVNTATSRALGLVHQVAGLISAPAASLPALISQVRKVLGPAGKVISLRAVQLPATPLRPGQLPSTYLALFKASAAQYCAGLSWTVLAAIGQIESGDGANVGPSSAGALGPMQFLPSTWAAWGISGFGRTGAPDVMNPYDAVPSAARMLCADGAAAGGRSLYNAIFAYNHADWYVNEVLALAAAYAANIR